MAAWSWYRPTGHNTPCSWTNPANAHDADIATYADIYNNTAWLELTFPETWTNCVKVYGRGSSAETANVEVYYGGAWHSLGSIDWGTSLGWDTIYFSPQQCSGIRIQGLEAGTRHYVADVLYLEVPAVAPETTFDVTADAGTEFAPSGTEYFSVVQLSTRKALLLYTYTDQDVYGRTVNVAEDGTITLGAATKLIDAGTDQSEKGKSAIRLAENLVVVAIHHEFIASVNDMTKFLAISISGDTLTVGTVFNYTTGYETQLQIARVSDGLFLARNSSIIGLFSVAFPTIEEVEAIDNTNGGLLGGIVALRDNLAVDLTAMTSGTPWARATKVFFAEPPSYDLASGIALEKAVTETSPQTVGTAKLDSTRALLGFYGTVDTRTHLAFAVVTIPENQQAEIGDECAVALGSRAGAYPNCLCMADSDRFLYVISRFEDSKGVIGRGRVDGTTVSGPWHSGVPFTEYAVSEAAICPLGDGYVLIAYERDGSSAGYVAVARTSQAVLAPTSLECEAATNPANVTDFTPEFTALFKTDDTLCYARSAKIQVAEDDGFSSLVWDTDWIDLPDFTAKDARSGALSYAGSALQEGKRYWWRIAFKDEWGRQGVWSTEEAYFTMELSSPTGVAVQSFTEDSIILQCDAKGASGYTYVWVKKVGDEWQIQGQTTSELEFNFGNLEEATEYELGVYVETIYDESGRTSLATFTGRNVIVSSVRNHQQLLIEGAAVVVLSEAELLAIEGSEAGEDLPALGVARVNKSDESGQCTILVPGNKGRVAVLFVPESIEVGGDVKVHIET